MISPKTPKEKTIRPSAMPGKNAAHHCPISRYLAPDAIMAPSSGVGGLTPAPTKLSPAVSRMAKPTVTETCTITVGSALGSTWRKPMRTSRLPTARAASEKGRCTSESTSERTILTKTGVFTKAMAMMMLVTLPPKTATSTIAKTNTGKD